MEFFKLVFTYLIDVFKAFALSEYMLFSVFAFMIAFVVYYLISLIRGKLL